MTVHFYTKDLSGSVIEAGTLPMKKNKFDLVVYCITLFGHCLGALGSNENEIPDRRWVFAQCIKDEEGENCNVHMTTVWME